MRPARFDAGVDGGGSVRIRIGSPAHHVAMRRVAVAVATALLAGCASAPPPVAPIPSAYRIGAPDVLDIRVLPDPMIQRTATVRPDGYITFDLIGDVKAADRTTEEIATDIEQRIARFKRDARVTVAVERAQSNVVAVFGEVGREGTVALTQQTRVADAIARQGGMGFLAWESRVRLIRTDGEQTTVMRVNMAAIQRGDLSTNVLLEGGDIIVVRPTPLGQFGYLIQSILFPFTSIAGPGASAANIATRVF